ncbi:interferon-inducible GTPase 5-like [Lampris incognitus]|uniref:interferon-inducible GTPase 5-like n=1 Tax=Lampris incognitus TaxID=2546036 RepID=UPI0024B6225F|nr:interferon-inducible GTPase 5-like [Lampris incognitus]
MENRFKNEPTQEIAEALQNNDPASAAQKIQEYLKQQENIPLNIAVTGDSGSGKSTFVNAFRGIDNRDEGAAPTGCVETTMEVTPYPHPSYPNVVLWDLPGIGTTKFPAEKYLKYVGFEKFDFFIIISADRFTENDVKLALAIQKMGKMLYFVRSKIDNNLRDEERSQRDFNQVETLDKIRKYCCKGLQDNGMKSAKVFLISNFDVGLYDFQLLEDTLEKELPKHKRDALLFAIPNINEGILNKRREAFQAKIKYYASLSALIAVAPVPGLSFAVDTSILVTVILQYVLGFGLDKNSLQKLARSTKTPLDDLKAVMRSPFVLKEINKEMIIKALTTSASGIALSVAEEVARFIPLFGIAAASALSFKTTYSFLHNCLAALAKDAQNVLMKALKVNP